MHRYKIWDLPTRVFHWALAAAVCAAILTAKVGGEAMVWHMRSGYLILSLVAFRVVWGFMGGHWSQFRHWPLSAGAWIRFITGRSTPADTAGHTPSGSLAIIAMLLVIGVQVATGLVADDEIATTGPFAGQVSANVSSLATNYHHEWGQWLLLGLIGLHLAAIAFYRWIKQLDLVGSMVHGDKPLRETVPTSRDTGRARGLALAIWVACCAAVAWWVG